MTPPAPPRRGRPPAGVVVEPRVFVHVRLTESNVAKMQELARRRGLSMQAIYDQACASFTGQ